MKNILTLAAISILTGCAVGSLPKFPELKFQYLVEVRDEEVPQKIITSLINPQDFYPMNTQEVARCLKFSIVSTYPYKIKFLSEVKMKECNLVGGFKPSETQELLNWIDDVYYWAQDRKKCFK